MCACGGVEIKSTTCDVTSLHARRGNDRRTIGCRVVDEYEGETRSRQNERTLVERPTVVFDSEAPVAWSLR